MTTRGGVRRAAAALLGALVLGATASCGSLPYGIDGNLTDDWLPPPQPSPFRPAGTGCFDELTDIGPLEEYAPFDCGQRHVAETYFVGDLPGEASSADRAAAAAECSRRADTFTGAEWPTGRLRVQPVLPSPAARAAGARWFRCDLAEIDLGTGGVVSRTGSLRGALTGAAPVALRCFDASVRGERVREMRPVPCERRHAAEFAGVWSAPDVPLDRLDDGDRTATGCRSVIADFAGLPDDGDLRYRVGYLAFAPSRPEWDAGIRAVRCFLWLQDGNMTGSYRGAGPGRLPINYG